MAENTPQLPPRHHSRKWYKRRGLPIPNPNTARQPEGSKGSSPPLPWYESTLLWGALGAALAMVLTVVAAMMKDLRWLLILAWPFFVFSGWSICKNVITHKFWRNLVSFASALIFGIALLWLNSYLGPRKESDSSGATYFPDRHLTMGQADSLSAGLGQVQFISKVEVGAPSNDGEAWDYASELETAFNNARGKSGWQVSGLVPVPAWDTSPGVTLLVWQGGERSISEQQIDLAFMEAGIQVPKHGVSPKLQRGEVTIWVGRKD